MGDRWRTVVRFEEDRLGDAHSLCCTEEEGGTEWICSRPHLVSQGLQCHLEGLSG